MRKIGSLIAIFSGFFQLLAGSLMLGLAADLGNQTITGVGRDAYAITIIIFGALTLSFGMMSYRNPRGISAFIILIIFVTNLTLLVVNGWSNGVSLTSLIVNSIGAITILIGIAKGNKKETA